MHHRRFSAIAAAALILASPVFTSCGFNYATDRINTIAAGVNDRSGEIDVLGAVVIAGEPNAGVFASTLANNSTTEPANLTSLSGDDANKIMSIKPVTDQGVEPGDRLNQFDTGGIPIRGSFGVGDFVTVTLTFDTGQVTTMQVNVVRPCFAYSPEKLTSIKLPQSTQAPDPEGTNPGPYSCDPTESTVAPEQGGHEGANQDSGE